MANQTDRLTTVLSMQGLAQSVTGLQQLAVAATAAAGPLGGLAVRIQGMPAVLLGMSAGTVKASAGFALMTSAAVGAVAVIRQVGQVMSESMRIADAYNQSLTRALVLFGNAGRSANAGQLAALGRSRLAFGFSQEATLDLAGQMAERGFSPGRIGQLLPALQNIEAGTAGHTSAESAMQMFLRVLERPVSAGGRAGAGGSRGLLGIATRLGITLRFTGNTEKDLTNLTDAINQKFGGVAQALANTASGVHLRLQANLTAALGQLGAVIEAGLMPAMVRLNNILSWLVAGTETALHGKTGNAVGSFATDTMIGFLAGGGLGGVGQALARGLRASRSQEAALEKAGGANNQWKDDIHQIALNTNRTASLIAQTVFGNISSFTRGSLSFSNLNAAISVRA